jgi:hypothetical protein
MPILYKHRVVESELLLRLASAGAIVIEGPKACGKTATAETLAASVVLLDVDEQARRAADVEPALVLAGKAPRLIDEWQVVPAIWNHVRRAVDARGQPGQFILTGSAVPADDITRHTGAGRLSRVRMRPMSLFESGHSTGSISVAALLGIGCKGMVLAGMGQGNAPASVIAALAEAAASGVPVVRSTRVDEGIVDRNVEVDDDALGLVAARALGPAKARVAATLVMASACPNAWRRCWAARAARRNNISKAAGCG